MRAQQPAGSTTDTIRILAYNIHHGEGMDTVVDLDRIAKLMRSVSPDIVAVQEVDSVVGRTGGVDQASVLGQLTGTHQMFGAFMPYQGGGYGMALLSRLPVVEWWNHRLPDGDEPRTSVTARVRLRSGRTVLVSGIHFYRTEPERLAQANRLLEYIAKDADPSILAGDFNSTPGTAVLQKLAETYTIPDKGADHNTFPSYAPDHEIDFVMFRPGPRFHVLEYRPLDEPVASDHRPIFMVLEVRGEAGQQPFDVMETTIVDIHRAMREGRLTAHQLVQMYLDRIAAFDDRGPSLNAISMVNPRALEIADSLDAIFARTGEFVGPLHGIPVIVKDNYDTYDLPTTGGSRALINSVPPDNAFMVKKVREAGGIVMAKSAMAEWAFSPYETIGSSQPGYTFNPYALNRVPAGSSGGTGASVAANLGTVGLGTDTGNSIRGPSSHNDLVGIRPTRGLTSRDGIIPLYLERDVGGPMARTVEDAARMLDVLAGEDPADSVTANSRGHIPDTYTSFLDANALKGARLGVVRSLSNRRGHDPEVLQRFEEAIAKLRRLGATVIDSVNVGVLDSVRVGLCSSFRLDVEAYFASLGPNAPVKSLQTVVDSGWYNVTVGDRLKARLDNGNAGDPERCRRAAESVARFRAGLTYEFESRDLDALIYPTWANPPRLIGDLDTPAGDNSQTLAPPSGFPAITVPMGWVHDGALPTGLQFLGEAWSEGKLIGLAYAWEQATHYRHAPASAPRLGGGD